jgi:uncharacterized HAD superfamily protein
VEVIASTSPIGTWTAKLLAAALVDQALKRPPEEVKKIDNSDGRHPDLMASPDQQRVSDQLVRLVQIFFALVLAQSLVLFRSTLLHPFNYENRIAVLALVCVFYTTVASWIDWHVAMARRPYDTRRLPERFRVYSDVGISMLYAYLLFTIEPLVNDPDASLSLHLLGYPLVFGLYLVSGLLRRWTHGRAASKIAPLVVGFIAYIAVWAIYIDVRPRILVDWLVVFNACTLAVAFGLMFGYRAYRRYLVRVDERAAARLNIGIDVDGVLANQIDGVLPLVKERHDVTLTYADITDWRLPIKDSDIAKEIERAQENRDYVLSMRAHEGAKRVLTFLHKYHRIVVVTARKGEAATAWTAEWLRRNNLPYDEVIGGTEAKKSEHQTDVLIDDFPGNVAEFLTNTVGVAVLVDQPWNREREAFDSFLKAGRLFIVANLLDLQMAWPDILKKAKARKETT